MNETICANEVICDALSGRGMDIQGPEQPNEELKAPANTAASPEESKSSVQEPYKDQEFESQPEREGFNKDPGQKPQHEGFNEDSCNKPDPEGFNEDSGHKPEHEGFNEDSGRKPYLEGLNKDSGQKPYRKDFNEETGQKPYPEGFNQDSGSKSFTIREAEIESDLYKPVDEAVMKDLKNLESNTPTPRTSTSSTSKRKPCKRNKDLSMAGQKMGKCAASSAADCAAVCCCPCVLAHLLVLALVKVPSALAMKAFRYTKRKARIRRKKKSDAEDQEEDGGVKKIQSYKSEWSLSVTPHFSGPLEGSPSRTAEQQKAESQKFWQDLYAGGHMGFGGAALERD